MSVSDKFTFQSPYSNNVIKTRLRKVINDPYHPKHREYLQDAFNIDNQLSNANQTLTDTEIAVGKNIFDAVSPNEKIKEINLLHENVNNQFRNQAKINVQNILPPGTEPITSETDLLSHHTHSTDHDSVERIDDPTNETEDCSNSNDHPSEITNQRVMIEFEDCIELYPFSPMSQEFRINVKKFRSGNKNINVPPLLIDSVTDLKCKTKNENRKIWPTSARTFTRDSKSKAPRPLFVTNKTSTTDVVKLVEMRQFVHKLPITTSFRPKSAREAVGVSFATPKQQHEHGARVFGYAVQNSFQMQAVLTAKNWHDGLPNYGESTKYLFTKQFFNLITDPKNNLQFQKGAFVQNKVFLDLKYFLFDHTEITRNIGWFPYFDAFITNMLLFSCMIKAKITTASLADIIAKCRLLHANDVGNGTGRNSSQTSRARIVVPHASAFDPQFSVQFGFWQETGNTACLTSVLQLQHMSDWCKSLLKSNCIIHYPKSIQKIEKFFDKQYTNVNAAIVQNYFRMFKHRTFFLSVRYAILAALKIKRVWLHYKQRKSVREKREKFWVDARKHWNDTVQIPFWNNFYANQSLTVSNVSLIYIASFPKFFNVDQSQSNFNLPLSCSAMDYSVLQYISHIQMMDIVNILSHWSNIVQFIYISPVIIPQFVINRICDALQTCGINNSHEILHVLTPDVLMQTKFKKNIPCEYSMYQNTAFYLYISHATIQQINHIRNMTNTSLLVYSPSGGSFELKISIHLNCPMFGNLQTKAQLDGNDTQQQHAYSRKQTVDLFNMLELPHPFTAVLQNIVHESMKYDIDPTTIFYDTLAEVFLLNLQTSKWMIKLNDTLNEMGDAFLNIGKIKV